MPASCVCTWLSQIERLCRSDRIDMHPSLHCECTNAPANKYVNVSTTRNPRLSIYLQLCVVTETFIADDALEALLEIGHVRLLVFGQCFSIWRDMAAS